MSDFKISSFELDKSIGVFACEAGIVISLTLYNLVEYQRIQAETLPCHYVRLL